MKNIDISKTVMEKVVTYERTNTSRWLTAFFAGLILIISVLMYLGWSLYATGVSMRTWDLVGLFVEDADIVKEYWQDTLSIVIYEISPVVLMLLLCLICTVVALLFRTHAKRRKISRVRTELAKHEKYRNNNPHGKEK